MRPPFKAISSLQLQDSYTSNKNISLEVLRLDEIHPVVSGNKIFKLHYFLESLAAKQLHRIITFGGAFSNHLAATAFACREMHIGCIGIVRGEKPGKLSHTLQQCIQDGMLLHFVSRERYQHKEQADFLKAIQAQSGPALIIPEGGYAPEGAYGASLIADYIDPGITHICCAAGTATTAAGILMRLKPHQQLIIVPVLKGMTDIKERLQYLTGHKNVTTQVLIADNYHFGGYAKKDATLIAFMNQLYQQYQLPTDFVYTAKLLYAVTDLIQKNYFPPGSRICCIHSGGLQGNLSLDPGILTF